MQGAAVVTQHRPDILCTRMAEGIGHRLSADQQNFLLNDRIQRARPALDTDLKICRMNGAQLSRGFPESLCQAGVLAVYGPKIQHPLTPLLLDLVRLSKGVIKRLARWIPDRQAAGRSVKAECQPKQTLQ